MYPLIWQEPFKIIHFCFGELFQYTLKPCIGFYLVDLTGSKKGVKHGRSLCRIVRTGPEGMPMARTGSFSFPGQAAGWYSQ